MANRPESLDDIPDYEKSERVADIQFGRLGTNAGAVRAVGDLLAALESDETIVTDMSGDTLTIVRNVPVAKLEELLAQRQKRWDEVNARYIEVNRAYYAADLDSLTRKWNDSEHWSLRTHAQGNGLAVFPLISAEDEERVKARHQCGEY